MSRKKESNFEGLNFPTFGSHTPLPSEISYISRDDEMQATLELSEILIQSPWMKEKIKARWENLEDKDYEPFSLI